jgi:hypothetical protein
LLSNIGDNLFGSRFVGISYIGYNCFFKWTTMTDDNVIEFQELEQDEETTEAEPSTVEKLLGYVKDKLSEEDFAGLQKELGISEDDLSNKELLEKLAELIQGAKPTDEEEEPEDEETEMMDQQTFMEECLGSGKSREECMAEWEKKAPPKENSEPKEEDTELAGEVAELKRQLAELKEEKNLQEVKADVEKLVAAKHLSPKQRDDAIKLASGLDPAARQNLYTVWSKQKFTVTEDVGTVENQKPGTPTGITPERRAELIQKHGLDDLIADKADKSKLPRRNN